MSQRPVWSWARRVMAALAGALAVACVGSRSVGPETPPHSDDPDTRWVRAVEIAGNKIFADDSILARLHYGTADSHDERIYRPAMVELDEQRVVAFYKEHGYFNARVRAQMLRGAPPFVDILISIDEGEPTRIRSLHARGVPAMIDTMAILRDAGVRRDDIFVHENYLAAKERLRDALDRSGYIHGQVDGTVRVDRERRSAEVEFAVQPGPLVRFGKTTIIGNRRVPDSAIAARMAWSTGEVFDTDKLRKTRKALFALDLFRSVRIDYNRATRSPVVDMTIDVRESLRHDLKLGGGLGVEGAGGLIERGLVQYGDTRMEVRGRGELKVRSFLDPLLSINLSARPGYVLLPGVNEKHSFVFETRAAMDRPDFLWQRLVLGAFVSFSVDRYEAYSERGPRAGLLLDRPFRDDLLHFGVGAQAEYLTFTPSAGVTLEELGVDGSVGVTFVHQSIKLDARDDPLRTHSGWLGQLRLEQGRWFAGASGRYARAIAELRGYLPVSSRMVLAARTRGGLLGSTSPGDEPISQRLFSGGSNHRGFGVRRLAPVVPVATDDGDITTVPVGGTTLVEGSLELRVDMMKLSDAWLGGALFVDAGDVVAHRDELDVTALHVAVGGGLRYDTPIGPIRLDVGVRMNRLRACQAQTCPDPDPDEQVVFHFSVGEAF